MLKKMPLFLILIFLCAPIFVSAQDATVQNSDVIEAEIIEIIEEREILREDGSKAVQQDVKLKGLTGEWKEKGFIVEGISDLDVVSSKKYEKGDKVVVNYHNEMIETEIVRALAGSIGLVLVVPIAAFLGIEFGK